jgi:hypothetical protein
LPAEIARCPGKVWPPFGNEQECIDCARRTEGVRDYMQGARVVWLDRPPAEVPCQERLEPKR